MIQERLSKLRQEMNSRGIDCYIVPTSDFHESEYVGDYFKARQYMTGFTGSAGTAVITREEARLWTDGRYFIQAQNQIEGTGFELMRMGVEGVPSVEEYVKWMLPEGGCIAFDGRVINTELFHTFQAIAKEKNGKVYGNEDLVGLIWEERPELPKEKTWVLEEKFSGESVESKLRRIREEMEKVGAKAHIVTCLYDIAWMYNLRGHDIECVPVFLSFTIVTDKTAVLYLNQDILTKETKEHLANNHVSVRDYEAIYEDVASIKASRVLLNEKQVNSRITEGLCDCVEIINAPNPAEIMKSQKNDTELTNLVQAHIKDGVAVTKFMYWLKKHVGKIPMTEASVADYLEGLRMEQEHFLEPSFGTISAYGANAAMMHYSASKDNCATLEAKGMLLVDSGGHYLEGSTDITRTFALGPVSKEEKSHFTAVCRSTMNLSNARFLYGCTGRNLDILARGPIWDLNLDYQCGTGHGVGYILNVHEGPNGFRWKAAPGKNDSAILEAGTVTTDEPGIYLEGKYGIRIENELICRKGESNMYGQFMYFENMTFAPIDLDLIVPEEMTFVDKKRLNDYHKKVYETIAPYLNEEEREWLLEYTRAI